MLRAMGIPAEMLKGSLRLTLSEFTTADEVEGAIQAVRETVETLRELRGWSENC
ncbi:nitrogen fixation protein S [Eubacterium sp. CAG:786]|nr:nitrogen fixation protein S [Eubacterium sp. CAG:786]